MVYHCDLSQREKEICFVSQIILVSIFFALWGGYSTDSMNYLYGFLGSPSVYNKEQLFYIVGFVLDKLFDQPWPLKIMSIGCILLLGSGYLLFFGRKNISAVVLSMALLHLAPAFFTLIGNALRQGFAASMIVVAIAAYSRGRVWLAAALIGVGYFFHTSIILIAVIIPLLMLPKKWIAVFLVLAVCPSGLLLIGPDLDLISDMLGKGNGFLSRPEGRYHLEKFFLAYGLAWAFLIFFVDRFANDFMVRAYVLMVCVSSLVWGFEIPFERLLGYSELVLPAAGASIVSAYWHKLGVWVRGIGVGSALGLGLILWTHDSMVETLFFLCSQYPVRICR